ncbi:MAG: DnaD domain protein [Clostridium sp.]|nr:DnaD domain protein [Clostridium sp.]
MSSNKRITADYLSSFGVVEIPKELIFNLKRYSGLNAASILAYSLIINKCLTKNVYENKDNEVYIKLNKKLMVKVLRINEGSIETVFKQLSYFNLIKEKSSSNIEKEVYVLKINSSSNFIERREAITEDLRENRDFDKNIQKDNLKINDTILDYYKTNISRNLSNVESKILLNLEKTTNKDILIKAIDVAALNNAKNLRYINTILKDWDKKCLKSINDINNYLEKRSENNYRNGNNDKKIPITTFNSYKQRSYDYDKLEKRLLGEDMTTPFSEIEIKK